MERSSDNSSPESEKPPAKSVKFAKSNMAELEEIWKVLHNSKENTNKLLEENKVIREQCNELQKSLEFHINKMEELVTKNKDLKSEVKSLKETLNEANEERDQLYTDLGTAINQIDDLEQYTRKHNLDIHGIPEKTEENLADQVITLGNALNVTIRRDDIDICHRMFTGRSASKPRPIIVRFKTYRTKKELYGVRKSLRNQNMNHIFQGAGIVYINENLTRMRRQLFAKVWKRKKSEQWHSAWTIDDKIFMKLSLGDHPVRIYSQEDLDNI